MAAHNIGIMVVVAPALSTADRAIADPWSKLNGATERRRSIMLLRVIPMLVVLFISSTVSTAQSITWVDFSAYPPGSLQQTGLHSADGLVVDVTFSNTQYIRSTYPCPVTFEIDDTAWPFEETAISGLITIAASGRTLTTELTFEFTNPGGVPAGGGIGIADLEDYESRITLTGYRDGIEVEVNWSVSFYQTADLDAPNAIWNSATRTLSGAMNVENAPSTVNNFSFLITDRSLDTVVLSVSTVAGDGVIYAITGTLPVPVKETSWGEIKALYD